MGVKIENPIILSKVSYEVERDPDKRYMSSMRKMMKHKNILVSIRSMDKFFDYDAMQD